MEGRSLDILSEYQNTGHRVVAKRAVKVAKRMADWRWGVRLGNDFEGNKNMFGKRYSE